jgi:hypothetical protein
MILALTNHVLERCAGSNGDGTSSYQQSVEHHSDASSISLDIGSYHGSQCFDAYCVVSHPVVEKPCYARGYELNMNRDREYCVVNGLLHRRRGGKIDKEEAKFVSTTPP